MYLRRSAYGHQVRAGHARRPPSPEALKRIALEGIPVLLLGSSWQECREYARKIHALSERPGPFVVYSCRTLPRMKQDAPALQYLCARFFESATSGTLYFDRANRLSAVAQRQLYSILEEGRYWVPGVDAASVVDFRVVASAPPGVLHMSLLPDLIYRLGVCVIEVRGAVRRTA